MAPCFDAVPGDLSAGASALADDSVSLSDGCASAVREVGLAVSGVDGGALADALAAFAAELDRRGSDMVGAIADAGEKLAGNARRYLEDDENAHTSLMGTVP